MPEHHVRMLQGNHACALGAIAAGCRFYAGYPITPSSEIAERMARELPGVGGFFVQMEDEIASMGAVIGAAMGGAKAMTATSGPGFSLKQENLGFAAMAEVPCVVIDVMRGGPSTGLPTRPSQGDVMQTRWGTHGDHPIVVLAPASVREVFDETVRAFNLAEFLRTPVIVLFDEVVGHLLESVELPDAESLTVVERKWATGDLQDYRPYAAGEDAIPAMARPGDGYRAHTTGLTHAEDGFPTQDPVAVDRVTRRLLDKLEIHAARIERYDAVQCDDVEHLIVAYGITARAAEQALVNLRSAGIKAGLFRPVTLWPFPERALGDIARRVESILVPEMNAGQLSLEIERLCRTEVPVRSLNRIDGEAIEPRQIEQALLGAATGEPARLDAAFG